MNLDREEVRTAPTYAAQGAAGFGMIDVLAALFVLSIGLLGIGGMMAISLRANDSSYLRTQATALAYNMVDVMRANRTQAQAQGYDVGTGAYTSALDCISAACTPVQMAQYDLAQWKARLRGASGTTGQTAALPSGDGTVVTATVGTVTTAVISVFWDDTRAGGNANASIVLETVL